MPTEAQKRAKAKWNAEHLTTLGCAIRKEKAEQFKQKCAEDGKSANAVLLELVEKYIEGRE